MSRELRSRARRDAAVDGNGGACVARPHHYHHPQSPPLPCHRVKGWRLLSIGITATCTAFAAAERVPRRARGRDRRITTQSLQDYVAGRLTGTSHVAAGHAASPPWTTPERRGVRV